MTLDEIKSGESKNIEFKVQLPDDSKKYMKTIVAFANKHTQAVAKVEGTKEWRRTNGIVDPAVKEYEAEAPGDVIIPTNEILQERDERLEKQPEILESSES